MRSMIPKRPEPDGIPIPAIDKDTVVYAVVMGAANETAFARFHPEFLNADGTLTIQGKRKSKDFWQYAKVKNFKDAYTAYLQDWLGNKDNMIDDEPTEISEDKKRKTISKMLNQLVKLIGSGDLTGEDLKTYSEIMKKVGWLKDEVEQETRPLRFLPARCGECRYRIGVESLVIDGKILDMCQWCKARKCAEKHGYRFDDGKGLLDVPKEVIADLEAKNNVELDRILKEEIDN